MSSNDTPQDIQFCHLRGYPIASDGVAAGFGIAGVASAVGMVAWGIKTGALTAGAVALICGSTVTGLVVVGGGLAYLISRDG